MTKIRSLSALFSVALFAIVPWSGSASAEYQETPYFEAKVKAGKLPPVAQRLPETPSVVDLKADGKTLGQPGGNLRILMARSKDVKLMVVYGYARLVAYTPDYKIVPDILEKYEVEEERIFTFYLRKGHRWSDGKPFTTDDFRYFWDDVANNKKLYRLGPPISMLVGGKPPKVEFIDKWTVRYTWDQPNPFFLPALAGASPLYLFMPAHYMKRFHPKYTAIKKMPKKCRKKKNSWRRCHRKLGRQYRNENPKLPTLQPWINTTKKPAERFVFVRNPYYYRVDKAGRQLPYIDRVTMLIASASIIPAKTGAGETDLQARYLRFSDFTFLKRGEKRNKYKVHQWLTATGAHIALYPNLNHRDPVWRKLFQNVRFRRALSLAVNRQEINQILYYGLATKGGNTVLPRSPLYKKEYRTAWAHYDITAANKLLDAIGLTKRDDEGFRLLPDGKPLEIIVEAASEGTEVVDIMTLIQDSWKKVGIRMLPKTTRREVFRRRVYAGLTHIAIWSGLDFANSHPSMTPEELAPTRQIQLQWNQWGLHHMTQGKQGKPIPASQPEARRLIVLNEKWRKATSDAERARIWHEMLKISSSRVYTIGIIGGVLQPVVVKNYLHNVPKTGTYAWDPGSHFGIYRPDTFWLDGRAKRQQATR